MPRPTDACPICARPTDPATAPFCGQGCRDRDLLRWLSEGYRLPVRSSGGEGADGDADGLDSPGSLD